MPPSFSLLGHQRHGLQSFQLVAEHMAFTIQSTVQITPFPTGFNRSLVSRPRAPSLTTSLSTQLICQQWRKLRFPLVNGLMRECKAALQKHLSHITQAQFVTQPPQHHQQYDISGIFQVVKSGSGSLVERWCTLTAPEHPIPHDRFLGTFCCLGQCTMGTVHESLLSKLLHSSILDELSFCQMG